MTLFIITLFVIIICLFIILKIIFNMAFAGPDRNLSPYSVVPDNDQYSPYLSQINQNIKELEKREFEPCTTTSYDGLMLYGRFYGNTRHDIVEIEFHGYRSSPYLDYCGGSCLSKTLGVSTLLVDQRSHGKSEGNAITFGIKERYDVLSWINYVTDRFGKDVKIFLSGVSMGASTVLMSSCLDLPENVIGILADCPYSSPKEIILSVAEKKGFNPKLIYPFIKLSAKLFAGINIEEASAENAVKNTDIPILIIHGDDDRFVPYKMGKAVYDAANSTDKHLFTVAGAGHGISYFVDNEGYIKAVNEFVSKLI